ncbi:MAG: hypothetical protein AVO33_00670 [delta proteobacterium ML8_F1]|nr:MAG: hypothetical protein AVO33_00670 [delta proteobacterium ML8_F1]
MKGWSIALVVILIIMGSLGSVYMLRAVGSLSIDIGDLEGRQAAQEDFKEATEESLKSIEVAAEDLSSRMRTLEEENAALKEDLAFLKEKFIELPGVLTREGTIEGMRVASGYIELGIRPLEVLRGEEAIRYLMETFDYSIQRASEELSGGYYRIALKEDQKTYRLTREAMIYLLEEDKAVEASLEELITYVQQEFPRNEEPLFSFYVIEEEIVEIKEMYLP